MRADLRMECFRGGFGRVDLARAVRLWGPVGDIATGNSHQVAEIVKVSIPKAIFAADRSTNAPIQMTPMTLSQRNASDTMVSCMSATTIRLPCLL